MILMRPADVGLRPEALSRSARLPALVLGDHCQASPDAGRSSIGATSEREPQVISAVKAVMSTIKPVMRGIDRARNHLSGVFS
jgi:hypothetical protein